MRVLALDTALMSCGVAVVAGDAVARRVEARQRGHAERLMPMIGETLAAAALDFTDIDLIAVTVGPGTFTGLRIGLAAAHGLGLALDRPVAGVTTLQVTAAAAFMAAAAEPGALLAVLHDARRGEVYGELFEYLRRDDGGLPECRTITAPAALTVSQAAALLPVGGLAAGSGIALLPDWPAGVRPLVGLEHPDPVLLARLAARHHASGRVAAARPLYLRAPDAKLPAVPL